MKRLTVITFIILIAASLGTVLRAQGSKAGNTYGGIVRFDKTVHDFGDILVSDGPVSATFTAENVSGKNMVIYNVVSSCGCTDVTWTREPVKPGESGKVKATYKNDEGGYPFDKTLTVYVSGLQQPVVLRLRGESHAKKLSLKVMTLSNSKQKVNDALGNPVEVGIAVMWKINDTAKAVFNVDNYKEYLSLQCDTAVRNIVKIYPYDVAENIDTTGDGTADDGSLRGSSELVAGRIKEEIQRKVEDAGLTIVDARITHLAYAPEIAAAMLQRQQAAAIVDARKLIVDGAVGMVEMALDRLSEKEIVDLDEERKAAMVSNLMVVLCGNKDAQPIVNSGSLY